MKDTIAIIKNTFNIRLKEFLKRKLIDNSTYNNLKPKGSQLLFVYDHPRVNKSNMPLRSIISTVNASCYKVAECLAKLLRSFHGKLAANSFPKKWINLIYRMDL